jgi:hypothetical protein
MGLFLSHWQIADRLTPNSAAAFAAPDRPAENASNTAAVVKIKLSISWMLSFLIKLVKNTQQIKR